MASAQPAPSDLVLVSRSRLTSLVAQLVALLSDLQDEQLCLPPTHMPRGASDLPENTELREPADYHDCQKVTSNNRTLLSDISKLVSSLGPASDAARKQDGQVAPKRQLKSEALKVSSAAT